LKSGDVLRGTVIERSSSHVILSHPDLGRMVLPEDRIESVSRARPDRGSAPETAEKPPAPSPDQPGPEAGADWKLGIGLGGSYTDDDEGPDLDLNTHVSIARERSDSSTDLDLRYIYGRNEREDTDNSFTGLLKQRWLEAGSPWSWLAEARYDFDSFRSWRHRVTAHAGAGYWFIDVESLKIEGRAGLGGRKDIGSEDEDLVPEGVLGVALQWQSGERHSLEFITTYLPALVRNDFRIVTTLGWKYLLDEEHRLGLSLRFDHEYATDPDPGYPRNNTRLTWGIQWDL
jgi:hypothetical protein